MSAATLDKQRQQRPTTEGKTHAVPLCAQNNFIKLGEHHRSKESLKKKDLRLLQFSEKNKLCNIFQIDCRKLNRYHKDWRLQSSGRDDFNETSKTAFYADTKSKMIEPAGAHG